MLFYNITSPDEFLYHYTNEDALFNKILPRNNLRMGPIACTNDPRETKDWQFGLGTNRHFNDLSEEKWAQLEKGATRATKKHAKLICFTVDSENASHILIDHIWERGFCRPRMWAQYAQDHKGVCLIFDHKKLRSSLQATCPPGSFLIGSNVTYRNRSQAPSLKNNPFILSYDLCESMGVENAVQLHVRHYWKELFFEKSVDWSQEREFRWLMWDQVHADHLFNFADSLKGIVVGAHFPEEKIEHLIHYQEKLGFDIGRLNWRNGIPEVIPYFRRHASTRA